MIVLDAFAIIAAFKDEPARGEVEALLRATAPPAVSAISVAEVIDVLARLDLASAEEVEERITWLEAGGLRILAVDPAIARLAGRLRALHYHRDRSALSLADCVTVATAVTFGGALATADPALAAVARAEGVELVGLPDTACMRP